MFLSLSLALGAFSTAACNSTSDHVDSRSLSGGCLIDCDDGGYESDDGYESDGGYEGGGGEEYGCTLTQGYWKNHNIYAKNESQKLAWPKVYAGEPICEDHMLDGQKWLKILETPPKGDPWYIVAHQWIAAKLNIANEASAPPEVLAAIEELEPYMLNNAKQPCAGKVDALALAKLLDDYNNGKVGPGHCGDKEAAAEMPKYNYDADICDGKMKVKNQLGFKGK